MILLVAYRWWKARIWKGQCLQGGWGEGMRVSWCSAREEMLMPRLRCREARWLLQDGRTLESSLRRARWSWFEERMVWLRQGPRAYARGGTANNPLPHASAKLLRYLADSYV